MLELIGKTLLGRYRVDAYIASGGMANVYRGYDKLRNSTVALKFMRPDFALDPHFEDKFRSEAATLSKLAHPNIVRYYELERDGKELFMVMDFIDGISLQEHLFDHNSILQPAEVLTILKPLARALQYAHSKGVIHRDIKPANIMLTTDKQTEQINQIFLTDFGIAKLVESATVTTVQAGTPAYMSPEQCASKELDHRSDQYSLAVLTYEMLAGRRPFIGESKGLPPGSVAESIRKEHLSVSADPPSKYNPDLPSVLDQALLRALTKQPKDRYTNTVKLYGALERALQGVRSTLKPATSKNNVSDDSEPKASSEPPPGSHNVPAALPAQRKKGIKWMLTALGLAVIGLFLSESYGIISINLPSPGLSIAPRTPTSQTVVTISSITPEPLDVISNETCNPKLLYINDQVQPPLYPGEKIEVPDLFHGTSISVCRLTVKNKAYGCQATHFWEYKHGIYYIDTGQGAFCVPTPTSTKTKTNTPTKRTPTATPYPQIKVDTDNLNMREGPGEVYDTITTYPEGTTLTLHGWTADIDSTKFARDWYRVSRGGTYGYVAKWLTRHHKGNTSGVDYSTNRSPFTKSIVVITNEHCENQVFVIGSQVSEIIRPKHEVSMYINNPGNKNTKACNVGRTDCGKTIVDDYPSNTIITRTIDLDSNIRKYSMILGPWCDQ